MSILGCELKCELCSMRRGAWAASGSRLGWVPDRSDFPSSSCLTKEPTSTIHSGVGGGHSGLTVTGAPRARVIARVAVSDTAVGAWRILTTLGPAQGCAPLSTFVYV